MGHGPHGLVVTETRHQTRVHGLKDAALGFTSGLGYLVQHAAHRSIALGCPIAFGDWGGLLASRTNPHPGAISAALAKVAAAGPASAITCSAESEAWHRGQAEDRFLVLLHRRGQRPTEGSYLAFD